MEYNYIVKQGKLPGRDDIVWFVWDIRVDMWIHWYDNKASAQLHAHKLNWGLA